MDMAAVWADMYGQNKCPEMSEPFPWLSGIAILSYCLASQSWEKIPNYATQKKESVGNFSSSKPIHIVDESCTALKMIRH